MSSGVASEVSEDSNSSSAELATWRGIEAKDLGSLLVQFEDASQSLDEVECPSTSRIQNCNKLDKIPEQSSSSCQSQSKSTPKKCGNGISSKNESTPSPLPEVLEKIRARRKRKLAIMLPMMMANLPKKGKGNQATSSAQSPSKTQKTAAKSKTINKNVQIANQNMAVRANQNMAVGANQNMAVGANQNMAVGVNQNMAVVANQNLAVVPKPSMAIVPKPSMAVVPKPDMAVVAKPCCSLLVYEKKTRSKTCEKIFPRETSHVDETKTGGTGVSNPVFDHDYCSAVLSSSHENEVEITLDDITELDINCVDNEVVISEQPYCDNEAVCTSSSGTNVGLMQDASIDLEEGEVIEDGNNNMCDNMQVDRENKSSDFRKTSVSKRGGGSGKRRYRGRREESPVYESDKYFDKLPSYCTDLSIPAKPPTKKKVETNNKITLHDYILRDPSPNRDSNALYSKLPAYHSCFTNSTRYDRYESETPTNYIKDDCPSRYRRRSSRSRSYSRSRSRSRGRDRRNRRSYSSESGSSTSSRSWSYSSTSCSSRSRSSSRDSRYSATSRSRSRDRHKAERKLLKEEEKQKQIEERRIVYVGKIPDGHTKKQLRNRFARFGEIDNVSTHFRENRDNYGFVTFAYTCDAYAAIEKGNDIPGEQKFDLCFGGRREFCDVDYMDLDGNTEFVEEYAPQPQPTASLDFDQLLKQAQQKLKRK